MLRALLGDDRGSLRVWRADSPLALAAKRKRLPKDEGLCLIPRTKSMNAPSIDRPEGPGRINADFLCKHH